MTNNRLGHTMLPKVVTSETTRPTSPHVEATYPHPSVAEHNSQTPEEVAHNLQIAERNS